LREARQAFLRLMRAHRFVLAHIPENLRLNVFIPGIVGITIQGIVVHGELRETIHDVSGRRGMGLGKGARLDEPQPQVFQDSLNDLPAFDEADDPHGSPTLRTGQGIDLPRSSGGQAPIFWKNVAQFFRYSYSTGQGGAGDWTIFMTISKKGVSRTQERGAVL
jgi:hypothetical protein